MKVMLKGFIGLGIIILLGTAGASDRGSIPFEQTLIQASIAVFFIALGGLGLSLAKGKDKCIGSVKVKQEPKLGRVA